MAASNLGSSRNFDGVTVLGWVVVPAAVVIAVFWSTAVDLVSLWATTQDYGHGYLIVPISIFLVWRRWDEVASEPRSPAWWALALVLGASAMWLIATLVGLEVGMQLALLLALLATLWTALGWRQFRWLAFPVGYIVFAIPVWDVVVSPLQEATATAATHGVRWLGIPVFREGPLLTIPNGRFEIAEVCAGLRFLMASMSLAALYSYLNFDGIYRRVLFFVVAILWSILFNWIRVVVVITLGHVMGMEAEIVRDHNSVGWVLFALSLVPLFIFGHYLQGEPTDDEPDESRPMLAAGKGSLVAVAIATALAATASAAGPLAATWLANFTADRKPVEWTLPVTIGSWERVDADFDWSVRITGADSVDFATYRKDGKTIKAYVARFGAQSQGRELISDVNSAFDEDKWSPASQEPVAWSADPPVQAASVELQGRRGYRELQFVYLVGARQATSPLKAKLAELIGLFQGRTDAAFVAIAADGADSIGDGADLGAWIVDSLAKARER